MNHLFVVPPWVKKAGCAFGHFILVCFMFAGMVAIIVWALVVSIWGHLCEFWEFGIPDLRNKLRKHPIP